MVHIKTVTATAGSLVLFFLATAWLILNRFMALIGFTSVVSDTNETIKLIIKLISVTPWPAAVALCVLAAAVPLLSSYKSLRIIDDNRQTLVKITQVEDREFTFESETKSSLKETLDLISSNRVLAENNLHDLSLLTEEKVRLLEAALGPAMDIIYVGFYGKDYLKNQIVRVEALQGSLASTYSNETIDEITIGRVLSSIRDEAYFEYPARDDRDHKLATLTAVLGPVDAEQLTQTPGGFRNQNAEQSDIIDGNLLNLQLEKEKFVYRTLLERLLPTQRRISSVLLSTVLSQSLRGVGEETVVADEVADTPPGS